MEKSVCHFVLNPKKLTLFCLFIFVTFFRLYSNTFAADPIVLSPSFSQVDIDIKNMEYCITAAGTDIKKVLDKQFSRLAHNGMGYTNSEIWVRFAIQNDSGISDFMIYQDYPLIDYCNLYFKEGSGALQQIKSGDQFYIQDRQIKHRHIIFPIHQAESERTYYLSYASKGAINIALSVCVANILWTKLLDQDILYFFCYGFVVAILFYNTFLYMLQIKEKDNKYYFWYILLLICYLLAQTSLDGLTLQYLWPGSLWWANHSICVFAGLMFTFILQFARSYLQIRNHSLLVDNIGLFLIVYFLIFISLMNFFYLNISLQCANIGGIILGLYLLFVPLYLWLNLSSNDAKFFFTTWILFSISMIIFLLKQMGFLPYNLFINNAVRIGFTVQSFLLSISLSQKIKRIQTELIELNNLKDDFLAKTTHELKTPLHGIIGISECLVDKPDVHADARKDLLSIIYSAQRLSNIVNDLLDATKIKKGAIVLKKISCDLKTAVDSTIDMTAVLNRTKKLSIENNIPDGLPCVLADEARLLQILQNLIENAIKYTESGSIRITAQPINPDYIECAVIDTGIGIPERDLDKIFLSFTQGNINNAGSGLGLSITKNLVELHGGQIAVASKEGDTTTFKFTLPVSSGPSQIRKEGSVLINKIIAKPAPVFLKSEKNTKHAFKIIAIDDDIINLKVLHNILIESNFQVIAEASGEKIVDIIRANKPDLVLLDIMMPGVDGFQVCKNIRQYYSVAKLPILFLTAKNQISDLVHGFKLGGNDYIIKPFSKDELLSRIDMHLNLKTANHRLEELCHFANSIGDTNAMRDSIITGGKYISSDKLVSSVAILFDGNMIFTSDNPMAPQAIKKLLKLDGAKEIDIVEYQGSSYLFANLANNYIILCELVQNSSAVYVKNILLQIRAIQKNITKLINNQQVLNSVYRVSKHLNECNYIKGEGKYTRLYTRNNNYFIELQLGQLEMFFYQLLWRVHRSYLINSKNIHRINKNGRGNYHINFNNGESIPVGNKYKKIIYQLNANGKF